MKAPLDLLQNPERMEPNTEWKDVLISAHELERLRARIAELEVQLNNMQAQVDHGFNTSEALMKRNAELEKQALDQGWVLNNAANRIAKLEEALCLVVDGTSCHPSMHFAPTCPRCTAKEALKGGAK